MKDGLRDLELSQWIEAFYTGGTVQWSSDGKTVFSTCGNVVKAINIEDGAPSYTVGNPEDVDITCASLLEEAESSLTLAYANGLICRYALHPASAGVKGCAELNRRWRSVHAGPIQVMKYSTDGSVLATGSADSSVKVWRIETQNCLGSLKGPSAVSQIVFLDTDRILVGYVDGAVYLFNMKAEKKIVQKWKNHTSQIVSVLLLNKKSAAFLSRDQTMSIVSLETYEKLKMLPLFEPVECGVVIGQSLYTVGEEGTLKCWQIDGAKLLRSTTITRCRIDRILYNEALSQFLLVTSDFNIYLVDEGTFSVVRQYVGFNDEIFDIAYVDEEQKSLAVAANSSDIRIYDTRTWSCRLLSGHSDSVLSLATASWDSHIFASSSKDNSFILWKLTSDNDSVAKKIAVATGHTNNVTRVRLSNTPKKKFIVSVSHDMTLKLWSLIELSETDCVKLSACSTLVAHTKDITSLDVSANDRLCVTGSMDKTAKLWHIDTKAMQFGIAGTLAGHRRGVWDVRFCNSTQVVGTCCGDCFVRLFSVSSCDCIATLSGHSFAVLQITFVNNGKQLISVDGGGLLKIWSISTKECISTIEAHDDKIWALLPASDESRFITGGSDGRVRIWEDITEKKEKEEEKLRAKKIQDEQTLANLMEQDRFAEALSFALTLEKPFNCFKVVSALIEKGASELTDSVSKLIDEQIVTLLTFASQWNTNSRTAAVAQKVLNTILHVVPPERLLKSPNFASVVETLLPYTKRHMERMSRLQESASFLDFVWSQMRLPDLKSLS